MGSNNQVIKKHELKNMIQINNNTQQNKKYQELQFQKFKKIQIIGRGGFGQVWKVQTHKTRQLYAMKQMSKAKILMKKSVQSVMNELQLLKCIKHDFFINALMAYQDRQNLYLIMDLMTGGDLRYHLIKNTKFSQQCVKFFSACIVVALQFLHLNGMIHRDVKPENLVFDKKGYLRLTDLGIARIWKPQNLTDTSGTPGYMAPQVLCKCNHGIATDYFALGVIVYQCMFGIRPYIGKNRQEIRDKILAKQVEIKKNQIPNGWSQQSADFINKTIRRKPQNRLGNNGPQQVKSHSWFNGVDWEKIKNKKILSPFNAVYLAEEYQEQLMLIQDSPIGPQTLLLLRKQSIQNVFTEYFYDGKAVQNPIIEHTIN